MVDIVQAAMPLFKYLAEEAYVRALIDKGEIFMRPLSYFRAFEDDRVAATPTTVNFAMPLQMVWS